MTSRPSGVVPASPTASGICSAGYAVRNAAGAVFSVTAGHCFANGANASTESVARSYGIVSGRRLPTVTGHAKDMELMGGRTYAGRVYTGGVFSTTSRGVADAGAAYEGYSNYCHSGRTTGENCGHTAPGHQRPGVHPDGLQGAGHLLHRRQDDPARRLRRRVLRHRQLRPRLDSRQHDRQRRPGR